MRLTGRTILITGGSAGIGLAFAVKFLELGNEVIVTGRREAQLAAVKAQHPKLHTIQSDVADPAQIAALAARVKKDFPVYGINIAKGDLKMKESGLDEVPAGGAERAPSNMTVTGGRLGVTFRFSRGAVFQFGDNRVEGRKLSMTQLAQCLSRFMDKPVVDQTSLKGTYDLTLDLSSEDSRAMELRSAIAAGVTFSAETLKALELAGNVWELSFARRQLQTIRELMRLGTQKPEWNKPLKAPAVALLALMAVLSAVAVIWK